jgi:hypothetical protein
MLNNLIETFIMEETLKEYGIKFQEDYIGLELEEILIMNFDWLKAAVEASIEAEIEAEIANQD